MTFKVNAAQRLAQVNASVGKTILDQLGGNKFIAMTGAKNLMETPKGLHFSIGKGAKNKANKVVIDLQPDDLYKIAFYSLRGMNLKEISSYSAVHADQLREVFTNATGFHTSL